MVSDPYSPDLNPIEMSFSKLKALLRKLAERTVPGLCRSIASFQQTTNSREARNYFCHAGSGGHLRGRRRQQRRRLRIRAGRGRYPRRALLPRNISVQVFRALLENTASFYGAQMTAMDNATRNAGDMIRKQTLMYDRTRQAMITKELIEIISGAEMV